MQQSRAFSSPRSVYLSYSVFETEFALQLAADLRSAGYRVWCDRLDVDAGAPLHEQVKRAIRGSAVLIAVLTPAYLQARYARLEWEFAARKRFAIVPLILGPIAVRDLPPEIALDTRLDFSDWRSEHTYQTMFPQLLAALDGRGPASLCQVEIPHYLEQYTTRLIARLNMRMAAAEIREMPDKADGISGFALRPPSPIAALWGRPGDVRLTLAGDTAPQITPFAQVSADQPSFVLLGEPGAGKSAALERLALDAAFAFQAAPDEAPLPLWLSLADWAGDVSFSIFLRDSWLLARLGDEDLDAWLAHGRLALYLDGLNELGGWSEAKAEQLRAWLASELVDNRVVVTCRSRDYPALADLGLPAVHLLPLDDDAIARLATAQLGQNEGRQFLAELAAVSTDGDRAGVPDFARTPAALNALLALYRSAPQGKMPTTLGGLFKRMLPSAWLCKRIEQMPGWLPFMPVEAALAGMARHFLAEGIPLSAPADLFFDGSERDAALRAARNAGLIDEHDGRLRFRTPLLLEYFAAAGTSRHDLLGYLRGARFDLRAERAAGPWDVVVRLMAGNTPNPDSLIRDVAEIDPFLAADCLASGVTVSDPVYDAMMTSLLQFANGNQPGQGQVAAAHALNAVAREAITPTLLDIMRSSSWSGRMSALSVLRSSESPLPAGLLRALRGWDWTPHDSLAQSIRDAGEEAVAVMLTVLDDPEWPRRRGAAWALGVLNDVAATPALVLALQDNDGLVRREAAVALGQLRDPAALSGLLDALAGDDLPVRRAAAAAIVNLGAAALPGVQERLSAVPAEQRMTLAEILGDLGVAEATSPLLELAQDDDPGVRGAAVVALGKLAQPAAVPVLTSALNDTTQPPNTDEPICYLACAALTAIGTPEALSVVAAWRSDQMPDGIVTLRGQAAPHSESDDLLAQLVSTDWETRRDAIAALALRGDRTYLPLIAEALTDADTQVRWAAARALGDFAYDPAATDALIGALADVEALVADEAVVSMTRIGHATVPALTQALRSKDANVRAAAVGALDRLGDPSVLPALKKLAKDRNKAPREGQTVGALAGPVIARLSALAAAQSLAASEAPKPAPDVILMSPDDIHGKKQPMVLDNVKQGMGFVKPVDPAPVNTTDVPTVKNPPPQPPVTPVTPPTVPSAPTVPTVPTVPTPPVTPPVTPPPPPPPPSTPDPGHNGDEPEPTTPEDGTWDGLEALLDELHDPDWNTRQNAARRMRTQARGLRGIDDPHAIRLLAEALRDDDYSVRWAVVGALAWLRDDASIPMLLEALHDKHFTVRLAVIRAFEEIGSAAVSPALIESLRDPNALVREKAAEALGQLRADDAEDALLAALKDREPFVRRAAAEALGELRGPIKSAALIGALNDEDVFVRMAAAEALGRLGEVSAVARLIEHLNDMGGAEWDQQRVCDVAAAALEAIGSQEAVLAVGQWRRKLNELRRGQ